MRWLLVKDFQILRRSPLLVSLLIIYPIVISLLIGIALSRGPEKPKVAFLNEVQAGQTTFNVGGERIDASSYSDELFKSIDPIRVKTREQALEKVRSGEALAAIIIPEDTLSKLASGIQRPQIEVVYNIEDPVKTQFVESQIQARLADANQALSKKFTDIAIRYLDLLLTGGQLNIFGRQIDILGLKEAKKEVEQAAQELPDNSPLKQGLEMVARFAGLAISNLDLSDQVLTQVASPIEVKREVLEGKRVPLNSFAIAVSLAISLMFLAMLLGSGMLALEREEHVFSRLVRGLVSYVGVLVEKVGLAALCAFIVGLVMLCGIGIFVGLDWGRFGWWILAMSVASIAFGAFGVAIGSLAREVRAASLLAFLLSLPIAFLALVPSGAVSEGLFNVIEVISAIFPFKPALQAINAALNDADPGVWGPLAHLVGLTVAFGFIARLALRRFG